MEKFWIIYLIPCGLIIAYFLWCHYKNRRKKGNEVTMPDQTVKVGEKKKKEDLQHTYDTVNSWLSNCDQKAGILLAVMGVAITVLMTGDFLKFFREFIFSPFVQYCKGQNDFSFSLGRFSVFLLLFVAAVMLIVSCCYLFQAIRANIDYDKMRKENPSLVAKSYIYYGAISGMKYDDFKKEDVDYNEDLRSQIYVNSKIAITKFQNYNEGLFWFKLLLIVAVMLFVAVMFVH